MSIDDSQSPQEEGVGWRFCRDMRRSGTWNSEL